MRVVLAASLPGGKHNTAISLTLAGSRRSCHPCAGVLAHGLAPLRRGRPEVMGGRGAARRRHGLGRPGRPTQPCGRLCAGAGFGAFLCLEPVLHC